MKKLLIVLAFLTGNVLSLQSQSKNPTDGTYTFKNAVLSIYNYLSDSKINSFTIPDTAAIDTTNFHHFNILLEATIHNGKLVSCVLPDKKFYEIIHYNELVPQQKSGDNTQKEQNSENTFFEIQRLQPYKITPSGNSVTFNFEYAFGDSRYDFPLKAELSVELTK